ncbi:acetyl-CoA carboxylase carboxyl transferase subunit alpha [Lactobacillus sp. S2-2]|uniref:carboxyltransferase subunit alpha n=1 Tax=Lactobacillus sp. S2-2 TaxID=2692917 RepID=UPI001F479E37|nr:carboxyltransferase subunit alpha [Lactobacillus sp. S2-2]MCF6514665.1 acetyl-CoA carboxylase carboxyl transferase subunit alpha [Lactobacillus sp. S2-2]
MSEEKSAFEKVQKARNSDKISIQKLVSGLTNEFIELHGDRAYGDDSAVYSGIGMIDNQPVTIIGIQKGTNNEENVERHFGSAEPDGYRKALRLMEQAEKFKRPIITLINTPGAYPGVDAEYHGQGYMISQLILKGMQLKTPYISVIIGEGGSGGALALAVGDCVWSFENSIYSVLSPEGYATILWKNSSKVKEAADVMRLTPEELLEDGIIDKIIPEVKNDTDIENFKNMILNKISELSNMSVDDLLKKRFARYRSFK